MKKIIIIICIVIGFSNCSTDFVERTSENDLSADNFFQSEGDVFLALNGIYSSLQGSGMYGGGLNQWQGIPGYDGIGDNAFNQYKWEGPGHFMEGIATPNTGIFNQLWTDSYRTITRANLVIQKVKEISVDLVPEAKKNELLGQAYFLRGLLYFNLAVFYEDAPLITEPQILEDAFVPKNTYEELTAQIVEDLKFASNNLPATQGNLFGYATKGAALALFARVQLYNKKYNGPDGVIELTNKVIGLGYSLHPNYAELFSKAGEQSSEIVFSVRFLQNALTNNGETFSGTFGGTPKVDQRPMPNLVKDYYCIDGLPITTSPLYDANNQGLNRDPRANATIYFKGDVYYKPDPSDPTQDRVFPGNGPTTYGMRKYIRQSPDPTLGITIFGPGSQDFYLIRYADVLLMKAEALVETDDLMGATTLVNQVRARVGMPRVQDVEGAVGKGQLRTIVRHERRVELALEGLRFMDLKRWDQVEEAIIRASSDPVPPYNPQYLQGKSSVFPIPQNEIDVNTKLKQHTAWQ
ncbi:MAG: RagB/SusD family nutrient uptake outer membrane protein [Polaribacter sp.]